MITAVLKYVSVFVVYFIVDVAYQVLFGISFAQKAQEAAGILDIYAAEIQNPILILVWFAIMTFAIVKLVVEPAVAAKSVTDAAFKGAILGVVAYGTLALPNGWSILDYPFALVGEVMLEGLLFAPIAASVTTWWLLRTQSD